MAKVVKRAYKYRFYPSPAQAEELSRTFGCVRKVYNLALEARSAFRWRDGQLTLATMDAPLDIVWSRPLPDGAEPSTVTVSRDSAGRWFVSLLAEEAIAPARVRARIADQRRDFLHKLTTRLVRDNHAVVIEDPNVRNMTRSHSLARAISDAAWGDLRGMLEYKADWYGRDINAARNIRAAGLAVMACGAGVRPQRESSLRGSRLRSRKTGG